MVIRENYLEKIRPFYHLDYIKILMGIRRCGKSTLIYQIIDELKRDGIDDEHIHVIDFDLYENNCFINTAKLTTYIESLIKDSEKYYLFFDEVQNVTDFYKVINSFNLSLNVSIFITGSNCDLTSSYDISLINKYISFTIYPLTFKEVCALKNISNLESQEKLLSDYLKWGGMYQILDITNDRFKKKLYD